VTWQFPPQITKQITKQTGWRPLSSPHNVRADFHGRSFKLILLQRQASRFFTKSISLNWWKKFCIMAAAHVKPAE
jgi:hypothetical protein